MTHEPFWISLNNTLIDPGQNWIWSDQLALAQQSRTKTAFWCAWWVSHNAASQHRGSGDVYHTLENLCFSHREPRAADCLHFTLDFLSMQRQRIKSTDQSRARFHVVCLCLCLAFCRTYDFVSVTSAMAGSGGSGGSGIFNGKMALEGTIILRAWVCKLLIRVIWIVFGCQYDFIIENSCFSVSLANHWPWVDKKMYVCVWMQM